MRVEGIVLVTAMTAPDAALSERARHLVDAWARDTLAALVPWTEELALGLLTERIATFADAEAEAAVRRRCGGDRKGRRD